MTYAAWNFESTQDMHHRCFPVALVAEDLPRESENQIQHNSGNIPIQNPSAKPILPLPPFALPGCTTFMILY